MTEVLHPILPTCELTVERDRIRVILFVDQELVRDTDAAIDYDGTRRAVERWLDGDGPLVLAGIERAEVYEILREGE